MHGIVKERDEPRKHVAEDAGNMQRHVYAREVAPRGGNDLEARNAPGRVVPQGLDT